VGLQERGGVGVAEVTEPDQLEPGQADQAPQLAGDGVGVMGRAVGAAEDQVVIVVAVTPAPSARTPV
jgi:hypothetical protein